MVTTLSSFLAAAWRNGNTVGRINEVAKCWARPVSTGMGDHLWQAQAYHPGAFTKPPRPTQPPTFSGMRNKYRPKGGDALRLGSKAGRFIPHVDKCVGGR